MYIAFLFAAQIIEGTDALFAVLIAVYNVLWMTAFNLAGGLERAPGAYVMANALYCVVTGFTVKVFLGEPGERNLKAPIVTMETYCLTMMMILLVCYAVRLLRFTAPVIRPYSNLAQLKQASITCLAAGFLGTLITSASSGAFASAIGQLDGGFPLIAIMLATTYEIRHSNGKRSMNWINGLGIGFYIFFGLVNFGKTAMVLAFVSWMVAATLQGYRFGKVQVAGLLLAAFFFYYYLTPYSQYVRNKHGNGISENIAVAIFYLSDLNSTRSLYMETLVDKDVDSEAHLFDNRVGFLDRTIIIPADDQLIDFTEHGNVFGITPTIGAYANLVPRFLWKDKPILATGNTYAHEIGGIVGDDDITTGISFSIAADAFHQGRWLAILTLVPINLFICFFVYDSLVGSVRETQVAMLPVLNMFVAAGESGLAGPVYEATVGVLALLIIVWLTKTAAPFLLRSFGRGLPGGIVYSSGNTAVVQGPGTRLPD